MEETQAQPRLWISKAASTETLSMEEISAPPDAAAGWCTSFGRHVENKSGAEGSQTVKKLCRQPAELVKRSATNAGRPIVGRLFFGPRGPWLLANFCYQASAQACAFCSPDRRKESANLCKRDLSPIDKTLGKSIPRATVSSMKEPSKRESVQPGRFRPYTWTSLWGDTGAATASGSGVSLVERSTIHFASWLGVAWPLSLPMVMATVFSLSAQQLGSRPHGRSFWRLRGGCHLASSPIGRIGAVTCQAWFVSLPCSQFPTAPLRLLSLRISN